MSQNYGALRVVRVRLPDNSGANLLNRTTSGWLPEDRLVHLLTQVETTIGRALHNDIILLDPTVSREHARLVLNQQGWHIKNLTAQNIVRVNGQPVAAGESLPLHPEDILILGSTMLQLIAPNIEDPGLIVDKLDASHRASSNGHIPHQQKSKENVPDNEMLKKEVSIPPTPKDLTQPDLQAQPWDEEEEKFLGASITMHFSLPQRLGLRTRWLIAGIGMLILTVSAIITIALNSFIGISAIAHDGISSIFVAFTIPLVPALGISFLVNYMDRFEREPWFLRLAAFLWGAIIAIPPALFIERRIDSLLPTVLGPGSSDVVISIFQGLNAGITEETVKGLGLILLFLILRDQFDNVTDGIVYGALIGAGFAMVENFGYFAIGSRQFLVSLIVGRIILGWLGHSTFTVCFGAALGYVRHTHVRWKQLVIPLLGYLIAVGLHSFFDFVDFQASSLVLQYPGNANVKLFSLIAIIGDYIPPFLAQIGLLYILMKSLAHEAAVIREFLAVEVSNGVVLAEEYALLQNSFYRTREERRVLWSRGIKQWMRVKELYQTEIGLAFRKWHVSMGDKPKLSFRQPEDSYRQRINHLRREIMLAEQARQQI